MVRLLTYESCYKQFNQMNDNILVLSNYLSNNRLIQFYENQLWYLKFKTKGLLFPILGSKENYNTFIRAYKGVDVKVLINSRVPLKERILALLLMFNLYPIPRSKYSYLLKEKA